VFYVLHELAADLVWSAMPVLVFITRIFQRKMQVAFEVRNQISNMNSFVQERVTGIKILQLFNREETESEIQGNQR
jgi:ABC-type multidrug transport system fused ATPase/permease subunit